MTQSTKKWSKTPYSFRCNFCGYTFFSESKKETAWAKEAHHGKYVAGKGGGIKKHRRQRCRLVMVRPGRFCRPALAKNILQAEKEELLGSLAGG